MPALPSQYRNLIIILIALQLLVIGTNHSLGYFSLYWYCDFAPTLFTILLYLQNLQAVKGFMNIILAGQIGYIIATLTKLAAGVTLVEFDFKYDLTPSYVTATILIHLSAFLVLLWTYRIRPTNTALWYSLAILSATYLVVVTTATPVGDTLTNYNFIFHSNTLDNFPYYTQLWVVLGFVFIVLPTHVFQLALWWITASHKG